MNKTYSHLLITSSALSKRDQMYPPDLLGRMPYAGGYQPTLGTEMGVLRKRERELLPQKREYYDSVSVSIVLLAESTIALRLIYDPESDSMIVFPAH